MADFDDLPTEDNAVAPSYAPPADGWATLEVREVGQDDQRDGKGRYAWFQIEVTSHEDADSIGKNFRHMAIIKHVDQKKVGGGLHNLLQISKAVGFEGYRGHDMDEYKFVPFRARIVSTPQKDNKERFNTNIREWGHENPEETEKAPSSAPAKSTVTSKPNAANSAASKPAAGGADWRSKAKQNG